ncbi:MAG: N(4)-(beta-N-acetylglucosaminyl)-L-asparaginase [marine benthic group bacterium]|nr:N(4)-(beta-N-acetylglucosaminyl)-L-asparaginase [Gemmatimonadota bacterium]MCL7985674.1 N(4)-(beta-N-acetylglucosaminyl)-L-asparaginase [Gemmatimonadota bacterium]
MPRAINRRLFLGRTAGVGVGALFARAVGLEARSNPGGIGRVPILVTSHSNQTGQRAAEQAWELLSAGGSALDAVELAANVIEVDPEDTSVGYGGLPNENGVVQLDASVMDGATYNAGAVASLEGIKNPSSVARLVMERTDHVLMVGPGALALAKSFGFEEEDLMTERSRARWLEWRENRSESDDWGPPDHLRDRAEARIGGEPAFHYGTVNVLAVDASGDVAGITTTSGLSWKIDGRVGDSPIIGAGLYVDNDVGAAGATGRGEDVIKSCASYFMVERMRAGRTPQQACEDALEMIRRRYERLNLDFMPGEKFVALNRDGDYGCAWSYESRGLPQMTARDSGGLTVYEGVQFGA